MRRRIVVTGFGMVTPLGNDVRTTWNSLVEGRSGIARITAFDPTDFHGQIAGEVKDFDPLCFVNPKDAAHMDRSTHLALAATHEAVQDSRLQICEQNSDRVGVIIGTSVGGVGLLIAYQKALEEKGPRRLSPFLANGLPDSAAGQVAITYGAKGPNMAVASACATGGDAIGGAAEIIRRGAADVMLAGGADSLVLPLMMAGFGAMRVLASDNDHPEQACKPFDLRRDGFVVGEGAAVLVLEALEHAQARGAQIYAEVAGYGSGNDAYHMVMPAEDGVGTARVMKMALEDAGINPQEVDYLNAHGTGTRRNDSYETSAIKSVFGDHAHRLAISSSKSMMGHLMGAAGAAEGIISILAIRNGVIPPTINLTTPDPECDLDYVPLKARQAPVRVALSNSVGLGGHNSAVVFRAAE